MNSNISNLLAKPATKYVLWGLAAGAAGYAGYRLVKQFKKDSYIIVPAEPEASVPADFNPILPDTPPTPMDAALIRLLEEEERLQNELPLSEEVMQTKLINVFTVESDWDEELERNSRTYETPYVIHADEYISDEMGFKQETLTYYAGDDIMANMADTPIYNWSALMGELKFGHGSKDKSVVYIRNEKERREWEILLSTGSYEIEILGNTPDFEEGGELKHSQSLRKFRDD